MQRGSIARSSRKQGPDVWQFRWSERGVHGERIYPKRVIGTVAEYSDPDAARRAVAGLLREINSCAFVGTNLTENPHLRIARQPGGIS